VDKLPVAPDSARLVASIGLDSAAHADFGSGESGPPTHSPIGIPFDVVSKATPRSRVSFTYADESERGPYPIPAHVHIEGGGDRHALLVDRSSCKLYELFALQRSGSGWKAGSGAIWNLRRPKLRPAGWTSADAAGLPIMPGLLSYDEVKSGSVDHAIRFTTNVTDASYVWPARHAASNVHSAAYPPMGARFRLSAKYNPKGLTPATKVVLKAMQKYGLILADNGSPWYFQGVADSRWPDTVLNQLKAIPASAFVAVDESSLEVSKNSAAVKGK